MATFLGIYADTYGPYVAAGATSGSGTTTPAAFTRQSTGLLFADELADASAWNLSGTNWTYQAKPTLLASPRTPRIALQGGSTAPSGQPAYTIGPNTTATADNTGSRELMRFTYSNGKLYLWSVGGDNTSSNPAWKPQLAVSSDRGKSLTKLGNCGVGAAKYDPSTKQIIGSWPANDILGAFERGSYTYLLRMNAATVSSQGVCAQPYTSDLFRATNPEGPYSYVGQLCTTAADGFRNSDCYTGCIIEYQGVFHQFESSTNNGEYYITRSTATAFEGPYTSVAGSVLPVGIKGQPENPKVGYSTKLGKWWMLVNSVNKVAGVTDRNILFISSSLTDWSGATRADLHLLGQADAGQGAIGLGQPVLGLNGLPVQTAEGYVPFDYDADPPSTTGEAIHLNRKGRTAVLEPSLGALVYAEATAATVFSDDFNRADGTPGNGWTQPYGTAIVLAGNKLNLGSAPGDAVLLHADNLQNGRIGANFTLGALCSIGIEFRMSADGKNGYLADFASASSGAAGLIFYVVTNGGYQSLADPTGSTRIENGWVAGSTHLAEVEFLNNTYKLYLDGQLVRTFTDSTYLGAGSTGLRNGNGGNSTRLADNYLVTVPAASTGTAGAPATRSQSHGSIIAEAPLLASALPASGGLLGLTLRQQANGDRYQIGVNETGKLVLQKVTSGTTTTLATATGSQVLQTGYVTNRLRVTAIAGTLTASLNGEQQLSYTDSSPLTTGTLVGTVAKGVPGEVRRVNTYTGKDITISGRTSGDEVAVYTPGGILVAVKTATSATLTFGEADGILHYPLGEITLNGTSVYTGLIWGGDTFA